MSVHKATETEANERVREKGNLKWCDESPDPNDDFFLLKKQIKLHTLRCLFVGKRIDLETPTEAIISWTIFFYYFVLSGKQIKRNFVPCVRSSVDNDNDSDGWRWLLLCNLPFDLHFVFHLIRFFFVHKIDRNILKMEMQIKSSATSTMTMHAKKRCKGAKINRKKAQTHFSIAILGQYLICCLMQLKKKVFYKMQLKTNQNVTDLCRYWKERDSPVCCVCSFLCYQQT